MAEENPIAIWVTRQISSGFKGFELYRRDGHERTLVDRYAASGLVAELIMEDARSNAGEAGGAFFVQALNDSAGPHPSRSIYVPATMPLHEPERFEQKNTLRLLLEHIDKQNRVIAQVVPACLAAMGGMVQGLSAHFGTLAETHDAAIHTLRESRVDSVEVERFDAHRRCPPAAARQAVGDGDDNAAAAGGANRARQMMLGLSGGINECQLSGRANVDRLAVARLTRAS